MRIADPDSPTKARILDAAMELMLAEGFIATSVDDICRKAGVTKGSFFHFFASKDELGKAVVEHFHCAQQARFSRAPFASERDPLRRALGMLDAVAAAMADPSLPKSCIIGNFSQELAPTRAEFRALCAGKFDHWIGGFSADLAAAAQARRMKVDAAGLGALFVSIVQGSLILIKAKGDPALGAANLAHFKRYVEAQFRG